MIVTGVIAAVASFKFSAPHPRPEAGRRRRTQVWCNGVWQNFGLPVVCPGFAMHARLPVVLALWLAADREGCCEGLTLAPGAVEAQIHCVIWTPLAYVVYCCCCVFLSLLVARGTLSPTGDNLGVSH